MRDASEALVFYHATTAWAATFVVREFLLLLRNQRTAAHKQNNADGGKDKGRSFNPFHVCVRGRDETVRYIA